MDDEGARVADVGEVRGLRGGLGRVKVVRGACLENRAKRRSIRRWIVLRSHLAQTLIRWSMHLNSATFTFVVYITQKRQSLFKDAVQGLPKSRLV